MPKRFATTRHRSTLRQADAVAFRVRATQRDGLERRLLALAQPGATPGARLIAQAMYPFGIEGITQSCSHRAKRRRSVAPRSKRRAMARGVVSLRSSPACITSPTRRKISLVKHRSQELVLRRALSAVRRTDRACPRQRSRAGTTSRRRLLLRPSSPSAPSLRRPRPDHREAGDVAQRSVARGTALRPRSLASPPPRRRLRRAGPRHRRLGAPAGRCRGGCVAVGRRGVPRCPAPGGRDARIARASAPNGTGASISGSCRSRLISAGARWPVRAPARSAPEPAPSPARRAARRRRRSRCRRADRRGWP